MPELIEQMYSSQQIVVPPKYPYILKRYCKAAIKTQPYDLLRWSYEYFSALSQNKPPPVKLRLEYPIYKTEGGLTRGCLKVMANQLLGSSEITLSAARAVWQGFCLDPQELKKIFCLCEVYMRAETVPFLHFIAVAGGLLTKTLTHTMILLCETLTKEPDGGSAAVPVGDFLTMYRLLAAMDASKDVKYLNGYREGQTPKPESIVEEDNPETAEEQTDAERKLKELSSTKITSKDEEGAQKKEDKAEKKEIKIVVMDEDDNEIPNEFHGMVAGRQMSTTSGEFIVTDIEKEIMDYVNDQIAILPDPDLKRKKAKPEEIAMVRDILESFLDENMDVIAAEEEEVEEEEQPIPDIIQVYAVPGIGPPVEADIMRDFEEYALDVCKVQADLFMPRNIRHFLCPPMEKYEEQVYDDEQPKKEEVPMGGVITD